jgi:cyclic beta-1,2-glucan synthetase
VNPTSELAAPGGVLDSDSDDAFERGRAPLPLDQLEAHARQLAVEHSVTGSDGPRRELLARLERNAARLEQVYKKLSEAASSERGETPSEEWLRDNHYVVRAQLLDIRRNLPRRYYVELPTLVGGRWRRYPRVYVFARDFVGHTAGRFDQELLRRFADAYQDVTPLTIGELWAIPIMLRPRGRDAAGAAGQSGCPGLCRRAPADS